MGAAAPRPVTDNTGQANTPAGAGGGSDYYRHLLENQKEKVANTQATQQAQSQPQQPPNRPGPSMPGFGMKQQGQMGPQADTGFQGAYDAYIQRYGGNQSPPPQQVQPAAPGGQPARPGAASDFDRNRPRRPGIRMGAGYASRD